MWMRVSWASRSTRARIAVFLKGEKGIGDVAVTGVQTCALPIWLPGDGQSALLLARPPDASRVLVALGADRHLSLLSRSVDEARPDRAGDRLEVRKDRRAARAVHVDHRIADGSPGLQVLPGDVDVSSCEHIVDLGEHPGDV